MILGAAAVIVLLTSGSDLFWIARLQWRDRQLESEITELQRRYDALNAEQARLIDDEVYVEGLIRSTFKHSKPGELVIPLEADPASGGAKP